MDGWVRTARSGSGEPGPAALGDGRSLPARLYAPGRHARERRLFWLLVGVWIVNLFDLCFTLVAMEQRILIELNPVAACLLPYGRGILALYKFTLLGLGTVILWRCRRFGIAETAAWVVAVFCIALALLWYRLYLEASPQWVQLNIADEILPTGIEVSGEPDVFSR